MTQPPDKPQPEPHPGPQPEPQPAPPPAPGPEVPQPPAEPVPPPPGGFYPDATIPEPPPPPGPPTPPTPPAPPPQPPTPPIPPPPASAGGAVYGEPFTPPPAPPPPAAPQPPPPPGPPLPPSRSGDGRRDLLGWLSLAFGIVGSGCCCCPWLAGWPFIGGVPAVVLGILHLQKVKKGEASNAWLGWVGVVLGAITLIGAILGLVTDWGDRMQTEFDSPF